MDKPHHYIILGAGPAGLQLAYLLDKANQDYLVLEGADKPGNFFRTFPRHRQLISINKRYTGSDDLEFNLRVDWNSLLSDDFNLLFTNYSDCYFPDADDFVKYLDDFSRNLTIRYQTTITQISRDQKTFHLKAVNGEVYHGRCLVVATGVTKPNLPACPGIESVETYNSVSVDPNDFTNQRVLIIGKGNSAFETADNLMATAAVIHVAGPGSIKMAWKTHYVGHLRAVNNNLLDTYQLKSQNAVLDGEIVSIKKINNLFSVVFSFSRANETKKELFYDRIIACTGFRFDNGIFDKTCQPDMVLNDRYPKQTSAWESTNINDLYFAGVLMQVNDYKKSTSAFVHGFRYAVRALSRILMSKHQNIAWPSQTISKANIADFIIKRVNRTSALWQQFEFMCDLLVFHNNKFTYYEELPLAYVHESECQIDHYFAVTLEYGPDHAKVDPFDITVKRVEQNNAEQAFNAQYLHPVIRHFYQGKLLATHHMAENLENEWSDPQAHQKPLKQFFNQAIKKRVIDNKITQTS